MRHVGERAAPAKCGRSGGPRPARSGDSSSADSSDVGRSGISMIVVQSSTAVVAIEQIERCRLTSSSACRSILLSTDVFGQDELWRAGIDGRRLLGRKMTRLRAIPAAKSVADLNTSMVNRNLGRNLAVGSANAILAGVPRCPSRHKLSWLTNFADS